MAEYKWNEEQLAVLNAQGNTLVSASAGSGKTTVMIEKIFRLLQQDVDLTRILVMTFSRASAQDMKNKLVEKIYKNLTPDEKGEKLRKQLDYLPFSAISTINSFCYGVMKKYFSLVGADPSATIMDENEQALMLDESLDKVIEKEISEKNEDFFRTLSFFSKGRRKDGFKDIIRSFRNFLAVQEDGERFLSSAEEDNIPKASKFLLEMFRKKIKICYELGKSTLEQFEAERYTKTDFYKDAVLRLQEMQDVSSIEDVFNRFVGVTISRAPMRQAVEKGMLSQKAYDTSAMFREQLRVLIGSLDEVYGYYLDAKKFGQKQSKDIIGVLVRFVRETEKEYSERKKQNNVVDFGDTERATVVILSNEKACEEIRSGYDYVFIDEYQDTNYLQESILLKITKGNLFAVGDVKQAIYRFRFAEPQIFNDRRKEYESLHTGTNCLLNGNYRSSKAVLDFTNDICSQVMTESFGDIDYLHTALLKANSNNIGDDESVKIYTYTEEKEKAVESRGVYRVKGGAMKVPTCIEEEFIAHEIERLIGKEIVSEKEGKRKLAYKDIAVLVRKTKNISSVTGVLQRYRIPFYVAREGKTMLAEREVLMDALRILLNDQNDIPLTNVLLNAPFYFTASELTKVRLFLPKVDLVSALRAVPEGDVLRAKVDFFFATIDQWRFLSTFMSVAELLKEILACGMDAYTSGKGKDRIAQLNAFISYVEEKADGMSVGEFIHFYDKIYKGNVPPSPADAVSVMTMHGSKGLEYPVVFLPFMSEPFGGKGGGAGIMCDRELGMAVMQFDEESKSSSKDYVMYAIRKKAELADKESEARLFYVALTRAKDRLILIGKSKETNSDAVGASCYMDWLNLTANQNACFQKYFSLLPPVAVEYREEQKKEQEEFDFGCLSKEYAYKEATIQCAKTTVSKLLIEREESVDEDGTRILSKEDGDKKAQTGTAMHTVMQYIDFFADTKEKVEEEIDRLVREELLTNEQREFVDAGIVLRMLKSPLLSSLRPLERRTEEPFVAYFYPKEGAKDKVLVQGIIDLMAFKEDGSVILVDYKMSTLGAEKLKERYSKQLEMYSQAIESILKRQVSEKWLVNIQRGFFVQI